MLFQFALFSYLSVVLILSSNSDRYNYIYYGLLLFSIINVDSYYALKSFFFNALFILVLISLWKIPIAELKRSIQYIVTYLPILFLISFVFALISSELGLRIFCSILPFLFIVKRADVWRIILFVPIIMLVNIESRTAYLRVFYFMLALSAAWMRFPLKRQFLFISPLLILMALSWYVSNNIQDYDRKTVVSNTSIEDTRSFLYFEVIEDLMNTGDYLFGRSLAGSYQSKFFVNHGGAIGGRRFATEVGLLNIFLYTGVTGVVFLFYSLISTARRYFYSWSVMCLLFYKFLFLFIEDFTQLDLLWLFFIIILKIVIYESSDNSCDSLSI